VTGPIAQSARLALFAAAALVVAPAALAEPAYTFHWRDWWLPDMYSAHGAGVDQLFRWIFAITMVALILVQGLIVIFLIKYRHREGAGKAHFIHGNTRLEMVWTLMPAVILAILALASKQVWGTYRYNSEAEEDKAQIMVVGEQFQWNVIYPGPDGHIGKYLAYPKLSDAKFRKYSKKEAIAKINDAIHDNPLGLVTNDPAYKNPDGTDWGDDDDWVPSAGSRPVVVPINKTVEVLLSAKDVLHDFFLPNFRVKLDAVPGMIGHIYFKPEKQSTRMTNVEAIIATQRLWIDCDSPGAIGTPPGEFTILDPGSPTVLRRFLAAEIKNVETADADLPADQKRMPKLKAALGGDVQAGIMKRLDDPALNDARAKGIKPLLDAEAQRLDQPDAKALKDATVADVITAMSARVPMLTRYGNLGDVVRQRYPGATQAQLDAELPLLAQDLKQHGIPQINVATPFELVCEELCGMGHGTMRGELVVLSQTEYDNFIFKNTPKAERKGKQLMPYKAPATSQPAPRNIAQASFR
jgi:cytochrome c oxidase subunit 2